MKLKEALAEMQSQVLPENKVQRHREMNVQSFREIVARYGPVIVRFLIPPLHNRITWFLVIFGTGLMSTPLWWTIAADYVYRHFRLHIPSEAEPLWGFMLVVAGLIYNVASASLRDYVSFAAIRANETDRRLLTVEISPTRRGTTQLVQVRVRNDGRRPVGIGSWWAEWGSHCGRNSVETVVTQKKFPFVLGEAEEADFLIPLGELGNDHAIVAELTRFGVMSSSGELWPVAPESLQYFKVTALVFSPNRLRGSS